MKTLIFVGPPGCGKTTLAGNMFRSGMLSGRKIYIINDDGDGTDATVDAGILRGVEGLDLNALTSGCIGCKDEAEFRQAVSAIKQSNSIDWLIVEPVGYAAGHEVPNILHSLGIHPIVMCLVDAENFAENLVDGFMPSQIKVASAVGLTKYGKAQSVEDPALEEIVDFVGEHNSEVPIFLLPLGQTAPEWTLDHPTCCHHEHYEHEHCEHEHSHHHHHHEDHDHGVYSLHQKLSPETSYGDIIRLVGAVPGIFRGKGVVAGKQWHMVQQKWEPEWQRIQDDRSPFMTLYSREPISADDFASITVPPQEWWEGKTTKEILRNSRIAADQVESSILRRLQKIPNSAVINRFGELVVYPEILSTTQELVRRAGVSKEVFVQAIRVFIKYWTSAANLLQSREWNSPSFDDWQRKLGICLGWYGWYHYSDLGNELMSGVISAHPAQMLFAGFAKLQRLHSNSARAKVQAEEVRDVAKFGLKYGGMTKEEILKVMLHCQSLAEKENRPDMVSVWQDAISEIRGF